MADGKIRITLEARQAVQLAEELTNQLNNVDRAATGANRATDKLGNSSNKAAANHRKLVESVVSINNRVRQLASISTATNTTLTQLNATVNRLALDYRNTTASVQSATAALNGLSAAQNTAAQSAGSTSASVSGLQRQMASTSTTAEHLKNTLMALGAGFSLQYATRTLMEFDHAMAQVEAISGATGLALDGLREKAKQLGATTIYTSGEAASAMKFLAQSGFDVNEIMAASSPVLALAQAGDLGLAQAAEIAAKALRGFRLDASEMTDVADVMAAAVTQSTMNIQEMGYAFKYVAPIAASMGVNIREASAYIGVLSDAGIDATMAGTALRRIMSELSNPTIKATKLLAAHGLTLKDVDIKSKGLTETIKTLIKAGLSVGEVFALFGDRGAPAFQTLAQQVDKVEQKIANLQNVTGRAQKMQEIMNQSLYASFKNFTSAIEFMIIQFAEESGALNGLKTTFFSTAEAIRTLARNMDLLAPIFASLIAVSLPGATKLFEALSMKIVSAGVATKAFLEKAAPSQSGILAFANGAKQATTSMSGLGNAVVGVAGSIKNGLGGALNGIIGFFGGWNLAIMGVVGALTYLSMQESSLNTFSKKFSELLEASKTSADAYGKSLEELDKKIKGMSAARAAEGAREVERSISGMRSELSMMVSALDDAGMRFRNMGNYFGEGAEAVDSATAKQYESVKRLWAEYNNGEKTIQDVRSELDSLYKEVGSSNETFSNHIARMMETAEAMQVAQDVADKYRVRLAILSGTVDQLDKRLQGLAATMENIGLLTGDQINKMSSDLSETEWKTYIYESGQALNLNKQQFKTYKKEMEYLGKQLVDDQRKLLNFEWTGEGVRVVAKSFEQLDENGRKAMERLRGASEESKKGFDAQITSINGVLEAQARLSKSQNERTARDKAETASTKSKTGAANKYASAVNKVNEDMSKLLMTDREFQQFKFEQELAKLRKTLGATNPEFQRLVQLWEQAKDLGLSSPKEIMKARTSFEEWQQVQEHGGDINWNKKALIEVQARYLEDFYKDDAKKSIEIKRWAEDEKRKITSGSLQKDTQALLQFWQDYINIACEGEDQYSRLLEQYYQERFAAYLALCNNEVAARKKAEDDKLRASRNAIDGIRVATRDWINENSNMAKQMGNIVTQVYDGIADALTDMVLTGKANWEDLGRTVLNELTKMIIKSMILANLMKLMGMIGSAVGSWFSGGSGTVASGSINAAVSAGSAYIGAARGGVFSGGNISDYSGSVMNAPTAFNYSKEMTAFARGGAVMGEAGWEGVLPLGRNSRGELGVKADVGGDGGFGGTQDVIVNIYNYSNEDVKQESGIDSNGNKTIDVWVGDMAADQAQKPGSNMNRAIRGVTGMKPQVTRR